MSENGSQPVTVSSLDLFSILLGNVRCLLLFHVLVGLHTFKCCDFYCLVELSEYLNMETCLCSVALAVVLMECCHLLLTL